MLRQSIFEFMERVCLFFKIEIRYTKIGLSLIRLAMKNECVIINSNGSLKAIKTEGRKSSAL